MIDEDFPPPLRLVPLHGQVVGVGADEQAAHRLYEPSDPAEPVLGLDRYIDMHPTCARASVPTHPEVLQRHPEETHPGDHLAPLSPIGRVKIEDRIVGAVERPRPGMEGVYLDAGHVGEPHQRFAVGGEQKPISPPIESEGTGAMAIQSGW